MEETSLNQSYLTEGRIVISVGRAAALFVGPLSALHVGVMAVVGTVVAGRGVMLKKKADNSSNNSQRLLWNSPRNWHALHAIKGRVSPINENIFPILTKQECSSTTTLDQRAI